MADEAYRSPKAILTAVAVLLGVRIATLATRQLFRSRRVVSKGLRGKLVLVTGASQGIGASLAVTLAAKGARVLMLARNAAKLQAVKTRAVPKDQVFVYPVDCADFDAVDVVAKDILDKHGCPDIIVNCAGMGAWRYLTEMTGNEIRACMDAPYFAAVAMCRAFLRGMVARSSGIIVNVNSPAAYQPWPSCTAYTSARWALRGLTEALRVDLMGMGIEVLEVVLGKVDSTYFENNADAWARAPPIARWIRPVLSSEQAADVVIGAIMSGNELTVKPLSLRLALMFGRRFPRTARAAMAYEAIPLAATLE